MSRCQAPEVNLGRDTDGGMSIVPTQATLILRINKNNQSCQHNSAIATQTVERRGRGDN